MLFYTHVHARGNNIYFRGFNNGKRVNQKIPFKPSLFVRTGKETKYKSLWGESLDRIQFGTIKEAREFLEKYSEVSNFPIFGNKNFAYQFISKLFPEHIAFDMSLMKIVTIDIETSTEYGFPDVRNAQEEVLLITVRDFNTKDTVSFGCKPYAAKNGNRYVYCEDEFDLLRKFINLLKDDYPDVITGWNCQFFDVAYLSARIEKVLGKRALEECSPYGLVSTREVPFTAGRTQLAYDWVGTSILDYLDLYKKFSFKVQESYKLDYIAQEELGKQKLKNNYSSFKEFYTKDWELFVDYNIRDVELVDELENKMKLIVLICTMAYDAKCNYLDIFSSVRTWDCILYNALLKKNIIVHNPPAVDAASDRQIMGAFVKEPKPGQYDWVVSFDATSLYPSIIMTFNMSPETLMDGKKYLADDERSIQRLLDKDVNVSGDLEKYNAAMTANGQFFSKERKGIFPELIEYYFAERQKAKKLMLKAQTNYEETKDSKYLNEISSLNSKQMAAKILMNSLYGAMGNVFFRYYDIRIAEGITMTGQLIIRTVANQLNSYLNNTAKTTGVDYSFYSDTDSTYITLNNLVRGWNVSNTKADIVEQIDKTCSKVIEPVINQSCEELGQYLNVYTQKIKFKREVIADRGIWIAKKRYALNVHNAEGVAYDPPKLKVMGMEIVRSSTPAPVRKALKQAVTIALTRDEQSIRDFVTEIESKWSKLDPEEIAFPRSVNGLKEYGDSNSIFRKGTPIHVRGALIYNHIINSKNLGKQYQPIMEGDKIKFLYLKEPNILGTHVISFNSQLPVEFDIHRYVDYDKMFEKSFVEPLNSLLSCIGWQLREQASLEGLFG